MTAPFRGQMTAPSLYESVDILQCHKLQAKGNIMLLQKLQTILDQKKKSKM